MNDLRATYSPEDNKLRLYSLSRLDPAGYAQAKAAGFSWAPKQDLFVAPSWTPGREDFLISLCGELEDEDTSLVDRAEQRAERFGSYSDTSQEGAKSAHKAVSAIADGIPFGQPILVGHHSEAHARRDATRIENGMRRAINLWETSQYWQSRAAGAIRAAKHKERPDVRARRIKTIEADQRRYQKENSKVETFLAIWRTDRLSREAALAVANYDHLSRCYPLAQYPRELPASQYEGETSLWSALSDGIITHLQARDIAIQAHERGAALRNRWLTHLSNRLAYERAMLAESGGLAADKFNLQVGGRVLIGSEWLAVLRINKAAGRISSVTTNARYVPVRTIEEIQDYREPAPEDAAKAQAVSKLAPLCNSRADGSVEMTTKEWNEHKKYSSSYWVADFTPEGKYAGYGKRGAYRQRSVSSRGDDGARIPVFLTDAKETKTLTESTTPAPVHFDTPAPIRRPTKIPVASLDLLTEDLFEHPYDSGNLAAGIQWINTTDPGQAEHYQFTSLAGVIECATDYQHIPEVVEFSIVTHKGGYQHMRTLYTWKRTPEPDPNAAFEAMREALKAGVQVVAAPQLFPTPAALAQRMVEKAQIKPGHRVLEPNVGTGNLARAIFGAGPVHLVAIDNNRQILDIFEGQYHSWGNSRIETHCVDFLACDQSLGRFDRIVMNPPFANGQDLNHIRHALTFLKPGGRLVAICCNGPRREAILRPQVEGLGGKWEELPADTFKSSGTSVNTALITVSV